MSKADKASLRRLSALIRKEFYQIVRDPSSILISIVLPTILLFLYGFGVSLDLNHLRIGLVLEDTAPDAQSFAKALTNSRFFDVKVGRDRREFLKDMEKGAVRGIVVIPAYFSEYRNRRDHTAPIQVIADGSEPNTASFVQNYVAGAWRDWLEQESLTHGTPDIFSIQVHPRYWYNEELESRFFLVPGSLAIIMTLIGTLLTALVVAREWERGTMEALMSTPVTIFELIIGKLVPYFILGITSMTLCVTISRALYGIPQRGSWIALELTTAIFLFTALGLGLLISTVTRNQFVAAQAAMVSAFLPAYILSGFLFEIASMPILIQWLTYLVPARYFVTNLQTIFLVGDIWSLILFNMVPMILLGLLILFIIKRITVKRLD